MSKHYGIVTGGFDPLHSEHVRMIQAAIKSCDELWVGVNTDAWLLRKKGYAIMPLVNRVALIQQIISPLTKQFHISYMHDDDDTAIDFITKTGNNIRNVHPSAKITFFNGGDRTENNIPEMAICRELHIELAFNCGNTSNSEHGQEFMKKTLTQLKQHTKRPWGYYETLDKGTGYKVKKLVVEPGQSLSMQRHMHREEGWSLVSGSGLVEGISDNGESFTASLSSVGILIPIMEWHRLYNPGKVPLVLIEVQRGEYTEEDDIERKE